MVVHGIDERMELCERIPRRSNDDLLAEERYRFGLVDVNCVRECKDDEGSLDPGPGEVLQVAVPVCARGRGETLRTRVRSSD